MDLHLEYPVTLRVKDRRRPLKRQRRVEEEKEMNHAHDGGIRRSSHTCSVKLPSTHNLGDISKKGKITILKNSIRNNHASNPYIKHI